MWAHSTKKLDEERVINEFDKKYQFPDLENPDTYLLLASILLQKRTNEYRSDENYMAQHSKIGIKIFYGGD